MTIKLLLILPPILVLVLLMLLLLLLLVTPLVEQLAEDQRIPHLLPRHQAMVLVQRQQEEVVVRLEMVQALLLLLLPLLVQWQTLEGRGESALLLLRVEEVQLKAATSLGASAKRRHMAK